MSVNFYRDAPDLTDAAAVREWIGKNLIDEVRRDAVTGIYDCRITQGDDPAVAAKTALAAHVETAEHAS